jgi:hypothetical protein
MKIAHKELLTAQSMATSFQSDAILIDQIYGLSFQAVATGSPVGSFAIQLSNDLTDSKSAVTNWTTYTASAAAVSAAGNTFINYDGVHAKWARLIYTATSGTGSASVIYFGKGA